MNFSLNKKKMKNDSENMCMQYNQQVQCTGVIEFAEIIEEKKVNNANIIIGLLLF